MIDINELRQSLGAIRPEEVAELLDRLEAAEKECDALRTKVEAMERQEPSVPDEEAAYNGWFRVQQGVAYDGMWTFARAAWMARAKLAAAPETKP